MFHEIAFHPVITFWQGIFENGVTSNKRIILRGGSPHDVPHGAAT